MKGFMQLWNFPVDTCKFCFQGWVVIAKEKSSGKLYVYCNECMVEWESPEKYLQKYSGSSEKYGESEEPTKDEVSNIGWKRYINKQLQDRLSSN
ncbi:hypothetical protein ACFPVX_09230 [Cohnella faecalis]|uniref:hypothetical protein n=1 Tax=Cohnella faecalis TaxID=2315694 RepID=UPI001314B0E5|nr:hypothetical protein [Cohnella faecalis]